MPIRGRPSRIMRLGPSRSIRYPITGPRMLPWNWARAKAPVNWVRLQANCSSSALTQTPVAPQIGPLAAVISVAKTGVVGAKSAIPIWVLVLGGAGIVVGLATYGRHVIATVGHRITQLTPSRGFAAGQAAATTIVIASGTGIPISTTHTLVGAVLGVGMARGIEAIDLKVVRRIFISWVITIPAGAILAIIFFFLFREILP